ncbi:adaptin N terminal region-domain-containing protein [Pholiota molesta]|nr:adaptin N terminal region-domain-containing protein [Pholiota molesta]
MASQQYLNTLSENATRLGMRLQETFSERTRDLAIGLGTGAGYLDAGGLGDEKTLANIRKQLDSSSDREKLDAMKRLVALISKGRNASEYFAQVVKNVASPNLEIRKLVYIYLLRYAEQEPDLALLSINTFQKDLADANPLIRAMALRVLSGIKVPMIGSIVVLAIRKCAADPSPYVRKAAALAVPKCYELDSTHLPALIQILSTILLRDRSPLSLGSVAVAFQAICPTRLDLLHPHYRRLCRIIVDLDEWGQVELMGLLLRYVRTMLMRPRVDGQENGGETREEEEELDKDLKLLLDSVEPVFQSRNPAVVLAATKVFFYGAPPSYWPKFVGPLLRLLTVSKEVERIVLADLLIVTKDVPHLFAPFYARFLVRTDDLTQVKKDKIRLLLHVLTVDNWNAIMREFIEYADDTDDSVVSESIRALGVCSARVPESIQMCLTALINMIKSRYDTVVSSAVMVLKYLVQTQLSGQISGRASSSQSPLSIIAHLARRIDDIKHAQARACVVWLVGQYGGTEEKGNAFGPEGIADWAPDVLRKLAKSFGTEASLVKLQTVTLASKLFVLSPTDRTISLLCQYIFSLARYDTNYDVRDRGRMLASLLGGVGFQVNGQPTEDRGGVVLRKEQVKLVLFDGKAGTDVEETSFLDDAKVQLGSLGRVTGRSMMMDRMLPDWLERGVEGSLRDSEDDAPPAPPAPTAISSSGPIRGQKGIASPPIVLTPTGVSRPNSRNGATNGPWTDLDSFYADAEETGEQSEAEESEGEEESEEEESSEDDASGSADEPESGEGEDDVTPQRRTDVPIIAAS